MQAVELEPPARAHHGRWEILALKLPPLKMNLTHQTIAATQADLQQRTADPDFYRSAPGDVAAALEELADVEAQLEQAYARWESLDR